MKSCTHSELAPAPLAQSSIRPERNPRYTARLALDDRSAAEVYRLRYDSYLQSGHIDPDPRRMFRDRYDDLPNCRSIVIYSGERAVASVRTCSLVHGSALSSPAMDAFPDETRRLIAADADAGHGGRGLEITRLVRSPEAANNQGLVFLLYRLAGYVAIAEQADVFLSCVRRNHVPFYKRLGGVEVSEPRPYPGLKCLMQLMACSRADHEAVRATAPVLDPFSGRNSKLDGFLDGGAVSLTLL